MATDIYPAIRAEVEALIGHQCREGHWHCSCGAPLGGNGIHREDCAVPAAIAALNAKVEALLRETGASEYFAHQLLNEEPDDAVP